MVAKKKDILVELKSLNDRVLAIEKNLGCAQFSAISFQRPTCNVSQEDIDFLINAISEVFELPKESIINTTRHRSEVRRIATCLFVYYLKEYFLVSIDEICIILDRSHSITSNYAKEAKMLIVKNPKNDAERDGVYYHKEVQERVIIYKKEKAELKLNTKQNIN